MHMYLSDVLFTHSIGSHGMDGDSSCERNGIGVKMETNKQIGISMVLSLYNTNNSGWNGMSDCYDDSDIAFIAFVCNTGICNGSDSGSEKLGVTPLKARHH